jgi:hypothetical protein
MRMQMSKHGRLASFRLCILLFLDSHLSGRTARTKNAKPQAETAELPQVTRVKGDWRPEMEEWNGEVGGWDEVIWRVRIVSCGCVSCSWIENRRMRRGREAEAVVQCG